MITESSRRLKSISKSVSQFLFSRNSTKADPKSSQTLNVPTLSELAESIPELATISEILPNRLYLSGCLPVTKKNLDLFRITSVLTLMTEAEEKLEQRPKLKDNSNLSRLTIRIQDSRESDLQAHFRSATIFIRRELESGRRVLVHCVAGVSRSVTIVLAYLIRYEGFDSKDAYLWVKDRRTIARPNDSFCYQLIEFEQRLGRRGSGQSGQSGQEEERIEGSAGEGEEMYKCKRNCKIKAG